MQVNTIRKVLTKKLEDWLKSIPDELLRKDVEKNLLVSGGSITSMLLNLPVNDYDIYIQSQDVLVRLATHYCKDVVLDGRKKETYIQKLIDIKGSNLEDAKNDDSEQMVRYKSLHADQVKLDISSYGIRNDNRDPDKKYQVAFLSPNAISLTDDIQIVLRFSGSVEKIHESFDYIHATNYFTFLDGLVLNKEALASTLTRELKYQGSLYPLTSIIRMKKFIKRGWNINAGEMLKIMFQVSELDLKNPTVMEEQLIGVDIAYFAKLIEILRETKKDEISSSFLNTIIDRVFSQFEGEEMQD